MSGLSHEKGGVTEERMIHRFDIFRTEQGLKARYKCWPRSTSGACGVSTI